MRVDTREVAEVMGTCESPLLMAFVLSLKQKVSYQLRGKMGQEGGTGSSSLLVYGGCTPRAPVDA